MKNLNTYISEGMHFKLTRDYKKPYNYCPKDKDELKKLIEKLIKERGIDTDLNDIDTSNITDMAYLFVYSSFNGDLSGWDVSNVTDMSYMFYNAHRFEGKGLDNWDVSNVKRFNYMFIGCPKIKQPKWYKDN